MVPDIRQELPDAHAPGAGQKADAHPAVLMRAARAVAVGRVVGEVQRVVQVRRQLRTEWPNWQRPVSLAISAGHGVHVSAGASVTLSPTPGGRRRTSGRLSAATASAADAPEREPLLAPEEGGRPLRVVFDPDAQANIDAAVDDFFRDQLGPAIRDDAFRLCPKRTGDLADSIEDHVEGRTLIVSASGSDERFYAVYVELGHRIVAWGHPTGRVQPPSPFLRPALYAQRAA